MLGVAKFDDLQLLSNGFKKQRKKRLEQSYLIEIYD